MELDGWAAKHAGHLDLNLPDDLSRLKALISEADVVEYSYQDGAFNRFGLSEVEILELNPNLIYAPLDYIPGFILALGTLEAIKQSIITGGSYSVKTSLTRVATWLHECTDLCEKQPGEALKTSVEFNNTLKEWSSVLQKAENTAVGIIAFPAPR